MLNNDNGTGKRQSTLFGFASHISKKVKRVRRTNVQLARDRQNDSNALSSMAQNMSNFVTNLGGKVGNVVNQFKIVWQQIKERDHNYEDVMTTTEFDEVENSAVNFNEGDIEYDDGGVGELVEFDNVMRSYLEAIQAQ